MGYTISAISGFSWNTVLKGLGYGLTFIKIFFLARLLGPEAFGLFSLTMIALGITEAMTETGINVTIVQSKKPITYFINSAWVIAIFRGFLISLVMVLLGFGLTNFYNQPDLLGLIALAALVPVIKGFINPVIITFYKDLSFKWDSAYRFSLIFADTVFAVLLVAVTKSVTGWVVALVLTAIFEVVISFVFFKVKPKFKWEPKRGMEILNNAKWLSLSSFFSYLHENVDNLIVGKLVGTFNLGLYQNAYALAHKPNYDIAKSVHHSTMPIYVRFQDDLPRLKKAFRKTVLFTIVVAGLLTLPLFIIPEFVVMLILGEQWLSIIPLVGWLAIAGLMQSLTLTSYTVLVATNRLKIMNLHQGVTVILLICFILYLGSIGGLQGVVLGIALSRILTYPILLCGVRRVFELRK